MLEKNKNGGESSRFIEKDNKGAILTSINHFARRDWDEFQDRHLFSRKELPKLLF